MKSILHFLSSILVYISASATPLVFTAVQMTGSTNDITINLTPVNNPVIWNGNFYWLPPGGTNLTTTNGVGYINLIPGKYNAYITGLAQSWQLNVTNSATLVNAANLPQNLTFYSGVQNLTGINGVNVSSTVPGNYLVDGSAFLNASVSNATSGVFPYNLAASTNLPISGLQGGAGILTNNYAGNVNLSGTFTGNGGGLTNLAAADTNGAALAVYNNFLTNNINVTGTWQFQSAGNVNFSGGASFQATIYGPNIGGVGPPISWEILGNGDAYFDTNAIAFLHGTISAASFNGNGSGLTSLNLSSITTNGTLYGTTIYGDGNKTNWNVISPAGELFTNTEGGSVVIKNGSVTASGTFTGTGSGLTNLNAATLTGTLPQSTLPGGVVTNNATGFTSTTNGFYVQINPYPNVQLWIGTNAYGVGTPLEIVSNNATGFGTPAVYANTGSPGGVSVKNIYSLGQVISAGSTVIKTGSHGGVALTGDGNGGLLVGAGDLTYTSTNNIYVSGSMACTNGFSAPYSATLTGLIPTNQISVYAGTATNWWFGNYNGALCAIATNLAGGFVVKQLAP